MEVDHVIPFQDFTKNETNGMLSPVYSTTDEDLTQYIEAEDSARFSEQIHYRETDLSDNMAGSFSDKAHTTEVNADKDLLSSPNNNCTGHFDDKTHTKDVERRQFGNDIKLLHRCDDEKNDLIRQKNAYTFNHELEFTIQNAISNLSINDIEETFTPFSQEFSQSILDNFDPVCKDNDLPKNVQIPLTQDYHDVIRTATISQRKPETDTVLFKNKFAKIPLQKQNINNQMTANKPVTIQTIKTHEMQQMYNDAESAKTSKPRAKKATNARNTNKDKTSEPSKIVKNKKSTAKVASTKAKTHNKKNMKASQKTKQPAKHDEIHITNTTQKLNIMQGEDHHSNYTIKPLTPQKLEQSESNKHLKAHKNRKDMPNIYSSVVINDLSWIEKIRFVREIPIEEYESFTVEEEFWENYDLPGQWNEEDFNY